LNNNFCITIDEYQNDPEKVTLKVHNENDILLLELEREEFYELCNMRYRMDFPELPAPLSELALVA
jgi:hypothetical protein